MATLFDRTQIGKLKLRNRIFMSPMGTGTDPDGGFSEQTREYYTERAAGGFGMIFTGTAVCSLKYEARACNQLNNAHQIERLQRLVESVHAQGAKVCLQLGTGAGRMALPDADRPPHSASAVPCTFNPDVLCVPFTVEEIKELEESYGQSAGYAKTAGVDAIEIHAYGGYMTDQFMSSQWNHRTDEYGGSFENRMRFPMNLLKQIRANCGEDFPVIVKMTLTHGYEGGRTVEEGLEIAKAFEAAGANAIHIEHGSWEKWNMSVTTVYDGFGTKIKLAEAVKKVVSIPVMCDGRMNDPEIAMKAVEDGKVDYIMLGKQSIADPEWPRKVKEGRFNDIRYCIGCCDCIHGQTLGRLPACAVNPRVGFENFSDLTPAKEPKKVLVIGGGVGGMQTALTAARRGHHVTIWEKESYLGGIANAAAAPKIKKSVRDYLDSMIHQVEKPENHISVVYNQEATLENIKKFNPDKIVLCTGARSMIPPVPGLTENPKVAVATDYLLDKFHADGKVVIIGAGLVGLETAVEVCMRGGTATVIEMLDRIVPLEPLCHNSEVALQGHLDEQKVDLRFNSKVKRVDKKELIVETEGKEVSIPYDYILVATGMRSNDAMLEELYDTFGDDNVFVVGNAEAPGRIMNAVHGGFHVAKNQL